MCLSQNQSTSVIDVVVALTWGHDWNRIYFFSFTSSSSLFPSKNSAHESHQDDSYTYLQLPRPPPLLLYLLFGTVKNMEEKTRNFPTKIVRVSDHRHHHHRQQQRDHEQPLLLILGRQFFFSDIFSPCASLLLRLFPDRQQRTNRMHVTHFNTKNIVRLRWWYTFFR